MTSGCKLTSEEICKLPSKRTPVILSLCCPDIDYPSRRRYLVPGETVKGNCSVHFRSTVDVESVLVRFIGTSKTCIGRESETHFIVNEADELVNPPVDNVSSVPLEIGTTIKQDFEFRFPETPICITDRDQTHKTCVEPITDFNHMVLSTGHIGTIKYQIELVVKIMGMGEYSEAFPVSYQNESGKGQVVIQSEPITLHIRNSKTHNAKSHGYEEQLTFRALYVRPEFYMIHKDVKPTLLLIADSLPHDGESGDFFLRASTFAFEETLAMRSGKTKSTLHKTYPLTSSTTPLRISISDFKVASSMCSNAVEIDKRIAGKFFCDISSFLEPFKSDGASFFGGSVHTCNITSVGKMRIKLNFATSSESLFTKTAILDHESPFARR